MNTSAAAARSIRGVVPSIQRTILAYVLGCADGATCDEIEEALNLKHQTASARVKELRDFDALAATDKRRATRSGRAAVVYVAGSMPWLP